MNVAKRMKFKITQIVCEKVKERICRMAQSFKKRDKLQNKVCFIKIHSKLSSVLLLCLLRIFMKQTLCHTHLISGLNNLRNEIL